MDTTRADPRKGRPSTSRPLIVALNHLRACDRARILRRLAELRDVDHLMRQPGALTEVVTPK